MNWLNLQRHIPSPPILAWYIVVILLSAILFPKLGSHTIYLWDESRLATNAYEMSVSNDLLIPTFQGWSDLWNTKPPLMIWCQVASIKIFGISEFAIRLPSALFGIGIFILLIYWFHRINIPKVFAPFGIVLLLGSSAFNGWHCLRTGDYEAPMIFFMVGQIIFLHLYLFNDENDHTFFNAFLICVILGVLTKGINSLICVPILFVWWFALGRKLAKPGIILIKIGLTVVISLSYYLIREYQEPGYLHWVNRNEIFGRFFNTIDQKSRPLDFYWDLFPRHVGKWVALYIPTVLFGVLTSERRYRLTLTYLLTVGLFYFVVINSSGTKTIWYDIPLIPILVMSFILSLHAIIDWISSRFSSKQHFVRNVITSLLCIPFLITYINVVNETLAGESDHNHATKYLQKVWRSGSKENIRFYDPGYSANNWWYIQLINDRGGNVQKLKHLDSLDRGDLVLLGNPSEKDSLNVRYKFTEFFVDSATFLKIYGSLDISPNGIDSKRPSANHFINR